jgi:hypothetical protein
MTALFIACGQDPACVVESYLGRITFELTDEVCYNSLSLSFFSLYIVYVVNDYFYSFSLTIFSGRFVLWDNIIGSIGSHCWWWNFSSVTEVFSPSVTHSLQLTHYSHSHARSLLSSLTLTRLLTLTHSLLYFLISLKLIFKDPVFPFLDASQLMN